MVSDFAVAQWGQVMTDFSVARTGSLTGGRLLREFGGATGAACAAAAGGRLRMLAGGDLTAWLGWEDSNSEMSVFCNLGRTPWVYRAFSYQRLFADAEKGPMQIAPGQSDICEFESYMPSHAVRSL